MPPTDDAPRDDAAKNEITDEITFGEHEEEQTAQTAVGDEAGEESAGEEEKPPLNLDVSVESPNACERHVSVTVSREDIDRYIDEAFGELMPKANVPGFRPGRAPRKLVEQRFRKEITDQVKGSLLMDAMTQATEEQDFSAISEPDFDYDAVEVPDEGPMTFEFDIEVRPEFELPDWKGLKIEKPVREFTDEDVDRHLKNLLKKHGELMPSDEPAALGDYLMLNMKFKHNGRTISESQGELVQLHPTLTFHDARLEDFDTLMVGTKAGDKKTTKITVSEESFNEELAGQEVDAEFQVADVQKLELPELTPEFLDAVGGFESQEELRDLVKSDLERQLNYRQQKQVREQITETLTEAADWELPQDMLKRQSRRELERAVMELRRSGFSEDDIRAHENELRQNARASTARALKEHFILERIAEEEDVEDLPQDYDSEISLIAAQTGDSPRRVRARMEKRGMMDALRNQIIERKVIDMITAEAEFKEVRFEPEAGLTEGVDLAIAGGEESDIPDVQSAGGESQPLPTGME